MKLISFIENLEAIGFAQRSTPANWYENHTNGAHVLVGIMAHEIDYLGHIPITVIAVEDGSDEETEKDYMTTRGAWAAIKRLFN